MRKLLLLLFTITAFLSLSAQNSNSFLHVEKFELNKTGVFILPEGLKKTDNNGKPWAMIEIVASGFDEKLLADLTTLTSSTLSSGKAQYYPEDGVYRMIVSSGVKGRITLKFQGSTLDYTLPHTLDKNRVYKMVLTMRSANLTILASPPEAKIYIDGEEYGENGYASVDLRMGEHTYSVECQDYLAEKNKTIRLEKNEQVQVELQPLFGLISITTHPAGADVLINGVRVGMTPYLMKKIQRGRSSVEVQLNGYDGFTEIVDINAGDEKELEYTLISFNEQLKDSTNTFIPNMWLRISEDSLFFDSHSGRDSIFVTTNNIDWSFNDAPQWLSLYKHNNILYINYMENRVHEAREADVVVYTGNLTKTLHVRQDVGAAVLKSKYNSIIFDSNLDSVYRIIETNVVDWIITPSADWIQAYEMSDTLVVICKENKLPIPRTGNIMIQAADANMKFDISQKAHASVINAQKEDLVVEPDGGTVVIPSGIKDEDWTCTSTFDWIVVTRDGDDVIIDMTDNFRSDRRGYFLLKTATRTSRVNIYQKGAAADGAKVLIESKPSWTRVFVDGKRAGRTALAMHADDSVHEVRLGRETRYYVFNEHNKIKFNTGLRYLQFTMSSETVGVSSGFIGGKHWGGYNHFQMNYDNWDFNPKSEKGPLYVVSLGPTYEILPWMSLYLGGGVAISNDTVRDMYADENVQFDDAHRPTPKELTIGFEAEAGLMFYYRNFFLSGGVQVNRIGTDFQKVDYSVGLGLYFNRYYDEKHGYCSTRSREWWSLNYVFNPVRNGHGLMFSDVGQHNLRWYFKTMVEFVNFWEYDEENTRAMNDLPPAAEAKKKTEIDPGASLGFVFNLMPGYIDFMIGGGYQVSLKSSNFATKGAQAELGFVFNIWRFPLTVMWRCCELEKDTRYLTVDFGVGFSFGNYLLKNKKK